MVTRKQIEDWLDEQVEANAKMSNIIQIESEDIRLNNLSVRRWEIQLNAQAVRYIADCCGKDLAVTYNEDSPDPYTVFILHEGVKFFGIETEEEYKERGAVV